MEWAVVSVVLRKSVWAIFFEKGPIKTGVFLSIGRKGERVFSVLRMFRNNFGICDKGGCSFVAVDHLCSELVGILRLFVFAFICILWITKIEGKIPFEFEDGVIPQFTSGNTNLALAVFGCLWESLIVFANDWVHFGV